MIRAWLSGLRDGLRHPGLVLVLWLFNFAVALPAAWVLSESIESSVGPSLVHEKLRDGFDMGWFGEYQAEAGGLESTFHPNQIGVGAFLNNLEGWSSGEMFQTPAPALMLGLLFAIVWAFLLGGVIARLARDRGPSDSDGLMVNGGRYFLRFVRLGLLSAPLYGAVYLLSRWIDGRLEEFTRDTTSESSVLLYTAVAVAFTSMLLVTVHVSFAYAKIATVLEKRRSMFLAALRGIGFVLSHPLATLGLYLMMAAVSLVALLVYWLVSPGIGQAGSISVLIALGVSQAYLIVKTGIRVSLLAGQMALYKERGGF